MGLATLSREAGKKRSDDALVVGVGEDGDDGRLVWAWAEAAGGGGECGGGGRGV